MKRSITQILADKKIMEELKSKGIVHLRLFGSHVHGNAKHDSDIDLLYEFDPSMSTNSRGVGAAYGYLSSIINKPIDFISKDAIHPRIKQDVLGSIIQIF